MELYCNRYEVLGELGSGAYGLVLRAKDLKTGLPCAIKIFSLKGSLMKRINLPSFQTEFDAIKNLSHPSIAKVYESGFNEEHRECFLVSEFIDGKDLFEGTVEMAVPTIELLLIDALRALTYMHQQRIFHFDIKPQNLLILTNTPRPSLKIIDFGLANFYNNQPEKKGIVGSPAYTAPEMIEGNVRDGRADLYSLGISFYKAFTRRLPFTAMDALTLHELHLKAKPAPLTSINPTLPKYLDTIFLKLLAKDPADRYQSASQVIDDLNFLSERSHPIETEETLASYGQGKLLGREKEVAIFLEFFSKRILNRDLSSPHCLVIYGKKGMGKTSFLKACRQVAQKNLIQILTWDDFVDHGPSSSSPFLILKDDSWDEEHFEYANEIFVDTPSLFIFSTSTPPTSVPSAQVIHLNNFSPAQTRQYLEEASGLSALPETVTALIHKQTEGNPAFLAEYVKFILQKGILKDELGTWSPQMLEILGNELEGLGTAEFIKKNLTERLASLKLNDSQFSLLLFIALLKNVSSADLLRLSQSPDTGPGELRQTMETLLQTGILESASQHICFSNPLYADIILEQAPKSLHEQCCDTIADFFEKTGKGLDDIQYFRGRGTASPGLLLDLARREKERAAYPAAFDNLHALLNLKDIKKLKNPSLLEMGEVCIELGRLDEAEKHLLQIPSDKSSLNWISALEQLGRLYDHRNHWDKSRHFYEEGLKLARTAKLRWCEVVFRQRMARVLLELGDIEEAKTLFTESRLIWKNELNEKEKLLSLRSDADELYYLKRDFDKALAYLEEIFTLLQDHPGHPAYPIVLYRLGRVCLQQNLFEKGEKYLLECLKVLKERHISYWLHTVYNELGNLFISQEKWDDGLYHYQHALRLARKGEQGSKPFGIAFNIGHVFLRKGNWPEAKKYFEFVARNLGKTTDAYASFYFFLAQIGLAQVFREIRDFEKSASSLNVAESFFRKNDSLKSYEQYIWQEKADLALALKNFPDLEEALAQLELLKKSNSFNQETYERWKRDNKI